MPDRPAARLVLVGVRGYGQVHARRIDRLAGEGVVELVAAVDPGVTLDPPMIYGVGLYDDLTAALKAVGSVDIVVIATPISTHFRLAEVALRAGADVYLEKPPVASLDDFARLLAVEEETGRVVQVGFQSLGSRAVQLLAEDQVGLGAIGRVGAVAAWSRTNGYWSRSSWAGRRSLNGQPVVDGVATNALAHAVVTALAVAGCRRMEDIASVETDLYRANAIDSDDTSVVRIRSTTGLQITCALTLCAATQTEPLVRIEGSTGQAVLAYTEDRLELEVAGETRSEITERTDLLENLVAFRRGEAPLLVPLRSTGAFMRVLDAVAAAAEPMRIDPRAIDWQGADAERRPIVRDVEHWLEEAVAGSRTFTELGVPWAHRDRDQILVRARVAQTEVAEYRDGAGTLATSSPRPYLHPVRTMAGTVLTAHHPADHDWHLGVSMAISDVNGTSFWGGGTYIHGEGYVLLDNHGAIVGDDLDVSDGGFSQGLRWLAQDGSVLLRELRSVSWASVDPATWRLTFVSELTAEGPAELASPGSKGRPAAGYGGFFWRFPACENVAVRTGQASGEAAVHGTVAPWLGWCADFAAGPGVSGAATLVVAAPGAAAAGEPWFVRVDGYPGLGSALAWDRPHRLDAGATLSRRFDVAVADGRLTEAECAALAAGMTD